MKKNKKDDIIFIKFKRVYKILLSNQEVLNVSKNHFDSKLGLISFILAFLENQLGRELIVKHVKINLDEWIKLTYALYKNETIKETYSKLLLNPIISVENISNMFECFNNPLNSFINYFDCKHYDLKMSLDSARRIIHEAWNYILYNCIECKIPYAFENILADYEYDQKILVIKNNTRLFSKAKKAITDICKSKINDLIVLLIGISRDLNYDK